MNSLAAPALATPTSGPQRICRTPQAARRPALGNQATLRRLQPKLTIGAVDDPLEREADAVADQVMRMPTPGPAMSASPPRISRKCAACEEEDKVKLQPRRATAADAGATEAPASVNVALGSTGQPLDFATRAFFEPRFGADLADVRVHDHDQAAHSARDVGALAYTVGHDIVFNAGEWSPGTHRGRQLLAHELTHVLQQTGAPASPSSPTTFEQRPPPPRSIPRLAPGPDAGSVLSRHSDAPGDILQRTTFSYGQANSCKDADHLIPYIWPGHQKASEWVTSALAATSGAITGDVANLLRKFFGTDGASPANVTKIHANFVQIDAALKSHYLYHCSKKGDTSDPGAEICDVNNAKTSDKGEHDITLCFTTMSNWSVPWAAWLIIHENVHRALGFWFDPFQAGTIDHCISPAPNYPFPTTTATALGTPDCYACFALSVALSAAPAAPAPAPSAAPSGKPGGK